jgi:hypothetical protein
MNRRKFITTTALALPSVTLLGAISTQQKTYRSVTSIYSNEEMTEWCNKNGIRYAKDDELGKKIFNSWYGEHTIIIEDTNLFIRNELLTKINNDAFGKLFGDKYVVIDIYKSNNPKNNIVIDFVSGHD